MLTFAGGTILNGTEVVKFEHIRMWAERGIIHIEDTRDNAYKVIGVREALLRMRAISDMIANSRPSQRQKHSHDRFDRKLIDDNQNMLDAMIVVVEKAKEQGMPHDPTARRDLARRRPKTFVVGADVW
jgi:hypothetical protein